MLPATAPKCNTVSTSAALNMAAPEASISIQAALKVRMKAAMKAGPDGKAELMAIRMMVAAMTTKEKEDGVEQLEDKMAVEVLAKLAKMRKESIEMYENGGKQEAADAERFELGILEEYLPQMADEATVRGWIATAITDVCPDGPDKKMMGKVITHPDPPILGTPS